MYVYCVPTLPEVRLFSAAVVQVDRVKCWMLLNREREISDTCTMSSCINKSKNKRGTYLTPIEDQQTSHGCSIVVDFESLHAFCDRFRLELKVNCEMSIKEELGV